MVNNLHDAGDQLYGWRGRDRQGRRARGEMRGKSPVAVKMALYRQGIIPLIVRKKTVSWFKRGERAIRHKDIALFSRQMATMLSAGVPIVQAFEMVARGSSHPGVRELILAMKSEIEDGASLSQALRRHPACFDALYCNLVQAGEQAGVLERLLDEIATYQEKTESVKGKIRKALFYPVSVILVALTVTVLIMIYVVPQFQDMFSSAGAELPMMTRWVIGASEFISGYGGAVAGVGVVLMVILAIRLWRYSPTFRARLDQWLLNAPVIGNVMHKAALARFARTTATLFAAGLPLVEVLQSVAGATGNRVYGKAVLAMRDEVATGQSLFVALGHQPLFPPLVAQMVMVGEESGALDDMLAKAADFYEEEVDNSVDSMSSLMEPVIMVVLGVLIGGLVIALYLPVTQLGSVLSGR